MDVKISLKKRYFKELKQNRLIIIYFCNMFLDLFIKGLLIGFMVSLPLGPIGILIIQKTVNKNRTAGFVSGLGVAFSDTCYAIIAGFSLTFIIDIIKQHELLFQIGGAIILFILGLNIFFKNPVREIRKFKRKGTNYFQDFMFTFLITFSNPMVILLFLAVLTGSGVVLSVSEPYQAFFIILGIFTGALLWWTILTTIISFFRHKFNLRLLWWFNKIAGVIVMAFVIVAIVYAIFTGEILLH